MDEVQVEAFAASAVQRRVALMCAAAIGNAAVWFPSARAARLVARLRGAAANEPSAVIVEQERRIRGLVSDLSALDTWRARASLVFAHLFPPASYMRATRPSSSRAPLAWLYVRRLTRGIQRWTTQG